MKRRYREVVSMAIVCFSFILQQRRQLRDKTSKKKKSRKHCMAGDAKCLLGDGKKVNVIEVERNGCTNPCGMIGIQTEWW